MSLLKETVLINTWKAVLDNFEACIGLIRINEGYEDCVITVCVSAGDSLDTFTVPRGEWVHGIAGALSRFTSSRGGHSSRRNDASKLMETRASSGVSCKEFVVTLSVSSDKRSKSNYVDIIRHMSLAEMKRFLSAVRDRLCLRAFVWPDEAKDRFRAETSYPIPGAPGRSNSRKISLILIITICVEVDEVWRKAILAEIQDRRGEVKQRKKSSGTTGKSIGRHLQCFRQPLDNLRTQQGVSNSGVTTTSVQKRTKENCKSLLSRDELLCAVRSVSSDDLRTSNPRTKWLDLPQLLATVQHPKGNCLWFKQTIPADGNCLYNGSLRDRTIGSI